MILEEYGADDCGRFCLLGFFRSAMLDPRIVTIIGLYLPL